MRNLNIENCPMEYKDLPQSYFLNHINKFTLFLHVSTFRPTVDFFLEVPTISPYDHSVKTGNDVHTT